MNSTLARACEGKSPSQGGMYLKDFREALSSRYPQHASEIRTMKRKDLTQFCGNSPAISSDAKKAKSSYFKPGSPLTEQQKRYCRCLVKVSEKGNVRNPWAICTKSVGREGRFKCGPYYNFDEIPESQVEAYAGYKGKTAQEFKREVEEEYQRSPRDPYY